MIRRAVDALTARGHQLRPIRPLGPAFSSAVWLVEDIGGGSSLVLKMQMGAEDYPAVAGTAARMENIGRLGLPVPRMLCHGIVSDCAWYALSSRMPGRPQRALTGRCLSEVMVANQRQAGAGQARGRDWASEVAEAGRPDGEIWRRLVSAHRRLAQFRDAVLVHGCRSYPEITSRDLVFGDMNPRNILFSAHREVTGIVDFEVTLGHGCRSVDLASLLMDWHRAENRAAAQPGAGPAPDPMVAATLRAAIREIGGQDLLLSVLAHQAALGVSWALGHGLRSQLGYWTSTAIRAVESAAATDRTGFPA